MLKINFIITIVIFVISLDVVAECKLTNDVDINKLDLVGVNASVQLKTKN